MAVGTTVVRALEDAAAKAAESDDGWRCRGESRSQPVYLPGTQLSRGRLSADEFPLAEIDIAGAGFRVCGARIFWRPTGMR